MHARAHGPNLAAIRQLGLKVIYLWRNLGDTIVSLDDHILKEGCQNPVCFIDNIADYAALDVDARHRYLIRHGIPWYLTFHLLWRQVGEPEWLVRATFEEMIADRFAMFSRIMSALDLEYEPVQLNSILFEKTSTSRFNVGRVGRSMELLSESNKTLLEEMLIEHPQDLSLLLSELPWWPSRRGFAPEAQQYDGEMIRLSGSTPEEEKVYLVRNGKRHWITSPDWLGQNGRKWTEVRIVSTRDLNAIPLGPPVV
jgi:hypothetical protein